ncbi:MAG: hypothetical protein PHS74_13180, partial [Lachnospiraceae bacterium]|nr:hypothetical protein [Lachnospiraceae bacterium]
MAFSKDRALQLKNQALVLNISLGILVVILIFNINPLPDSICLMVAVLMSAILIFTTVSINEHLILCNPIVVFLGK